MKSKDFKFNDKLYRLELYKPEDGMEHGLRLYEYPYGDQKELLSQMLKKIISQSSAHGIDEKVERYVIVERPVKKANEETTTLTLAEALFNYLERTKTETI